MKWEYLEQIFLRVPRFITLRTVTRHERRYYAGLSGHICKASTQESEAVIGSSVPTWAVY